MPLTLRVANFKAINGNGNETIINSRFTAVCEFACSLR